jgi:hypothetical protein
LWWPFPDGPTTNDSDLREKIAKLELELGFLADWLMLARARTQFDLWMDDCWLFQHEKQCQFASIVY